MTGWHPYAQLRTRYPADGPQVGDKVVVEGEGPGRIKGGQLYMADAPEGGYHVEFDDAPGFTWLIERSQITVLS